MRKPRSIVRSVTRAHALAVLLSGVLTAAVAGAAALQVLLVQDDAAALALARTLGSELAEHRDASASELGELIRHEQLEQRWFRRDVEVWSDRSLQLGQGAPAGRMSAWSQAPEGCVNARVAGAWSRVCVGRVERSPATVLVASPISALVRASMPVILVVGLTAVLCAVFFAISGRWAILRSLSPLSRFEERLAAHDGGPQTRLPTEGWGAAEIERLALAFNALLERVAKGLEREQRFVANAAHELRTPLTRLRGQIELAAAELADSGATPARLALAARSCEELTRTTESLLALSRQAACADEAVDLTEIAQRMRDAGARVSVLEHGEVPVRGDRDLLTLAARNLVDNALKYAGSEVRVGVDRVAGYGEIFVEDLGPGIPAEELSRVREPFVRGARKAGEVRGSGLGLSLVDHVARLHHGRLDLRVRAPRGLRAVLAIPLHESDVRPAQP